MKKQTCCMDGSFHWCSSECLFLILKPVYFFAVQWTDECWGTFMWSLEARLVFLVFRPLDWAVLAPVPPTVAECDEGVLVWRPWPALLVCSSCQALVLCPCPSCVLSSLFHVLFWRSVSSSSELTSLPSSSPWLSPPVSRLLLCVLKSCLSLSVCWFVRFVVGLVPPCKSFFFLLQCSWISFGFWILDFGFCLNKAPPAYTLLSPAYRGRRNKPGGWLEDVLLWNRKYLFNISLANANYFNFDLN